MVLSLASGSQTPPKVSDLPATPAELVKVWCGGLAGQERSVEEKEVVLRALRCCRFTELHEAILTAVTPLLLDPTPSLRLQAAGCVLHYLSSAPSDVLKLLTPSLVTAVTRTLSALRFQLPSAPSSTLPRLASTCLRILNALALKLSPVLSETVATLATLLSTWIHHGRTASAGGASPALSLVDRGKAPAQGQLALGVMSAFTQPPPSPRRRAREDSDVSVASSRATSVGRGAESGSEDEGGQPPDRRRDAAQIRLDALTCLRTLATNNSKALHKHWPLFLADSPYLRSRPTLFTLMESDPSRSVRLQACNAFSAMLEGSANYLAIAEDRPSKASFTSLSSSVGETVSEMHISLSSLLSLPIAAGQTDFRLAVLDAAAKLAANAPYGRMQRPLAWNLAKAVLPMLSSVDPAVVAAAASCLAVIATRYTSTSSTQPFEWDQLTSAAEPLVQDSRPEEAQRAGWTLLAATLPPQAGLDWTPLLRPLDQSLFLSSPTAIQEAQTAFHVAILRLSPSPTYPLRYLPLAAAHLALAASSPHAGVRLKACEALAFPSLTTSPSDVVDDVFFNSARTLPSLHSWPLALSLASTDPSPAVRAGACRALGLLAKAEGSSEAVVLGREENLAEAVRVLLNGLRRDGEESDEAGVVWALANCCDALRVEDLEKVDPVEVLQATCTNSLRIVGALLKFLPAVSSRNNPLADRIEAALCAGLAHPAAKVRWNAAIASSTFFSSLFLSVHPYPSPNPSRPLRLLSALTALLLTDSSFKARIHAVGALTAAFSSSIAPADERKETGRKVRQARGRLGGEVEEGKVPGKEKAHAEVLMKRLDAFLAQCA
ncbi:hypothetical protein JCM6882_007479 [Rhodosporidiobolus microsporus]